MKLLRLPQKGFVLNSNTFQIISYKFFIIDMKQSKTYILDEDEHLQNIRKIVKRDYFGTGEQTQTPQLNLNDYLSTHKSNENQLFSELVELDSEEWKKKHWWVDKQEKMLMIAYDQIQKSQKYKSKPFHNMIEANPDINGINTLQVQQQAKNGIFFHRDKNYGSYQSAQYEQSKKIVYKNCRLQDNSHTFENIQNFLKQEDIKKVKIQEKTPRREPQRRRNNSGQLNSPISENEEEEEPLITWGQVESTPLRISGPEYRLPATPQRDLILSNLNTRIKQKKHVSKKSEKVMRLLESITPGTSKNRYTSSIRKGVKSSVRDDQEKGTVVRGLLNFKK